MVEGASSAATRRPAGDEHVAHLVEERGVRTVVDLRGETEVEAFPNQPMADAGVTVHHPADRPGGARKTRRRSEIDWETLTLIGLYQHLLANSGPQFAQALRIICDPANHPLVFHCAAGKDHAGLTAAVTHSGCSAWATTRSSTTTRTAAVVDELMARAVAGATQGARHTTAS
ncbi:MAG: tyrosine-protein phosphatase [Acidimicrobiia bacterium]